MFPVGMADRSRTRHSMKLTLPLLLPWLVGPLMAADIPVSVGNTSLTIPEPAGYVRVPSGTAFDRLQESTVVPQNERLASFVPEEFLPAIQRNQMPATSSTLRLQ